MTTFTALSDTTLSQDKPLTQSVARAFRDNPVAIGEGDVTAPRVSSNAIASQYFRVERTTNQPRTGTGANVLALNSKVFDPDNLFDAVTNFRFTPTVPGLYQIYLKVVSSSIGVAGQLSADIMKNGTSVGGAYDYQSSASQPLCVVVSTIVQMNGTTDYISGQYAQAVTTTTYNVQGEMWGVGLCEV